MYGHFLIFPIYTLAFHVWFPEEKRKRERKQSVEEGATPLNPLEIILVEGEGL